MREINLYHLSSEIYYHGRGVKDTAIVSGMCCDDTIKVVFDDGMICYVAIDPDYPLCINYSYYTDEDSQDEFSTGSHDFDGESDYMGGVKDICGGVRNA